MADLGQAINFLTAIGSPIIHLNGELPRKLKSRDSLAFLRA